MFQALFSENKLSFLPFFSKAKPVVVNTTPVRMSVPLVSAQTVKQVSVTELVFPVSPKQTIQFYNWKLRFTYKRYMLNGEAVKFTSVNSSFFKVVPKPINPTSQIVTTEALWSPWQIRALVLQDKQDKDGPCSCSLPSREEETEQTNKETKPKTPTQRWALWREGNRVRCIRGGQGTVL